MRFVQVSGEEERLWLKDCEPQALASCYASMCEKWHEKRLHMPADLTILQSLKICNHLV